MTITEIAIKRPTLVVVLFTVLGVLGLFSLSRLNYELLPKMTPPIITISTVYPGASPSEVENSVSKLLEDAVSGIDKIVAVRSNSFEGRSLLIIEFEQSANINISLQDAQRKINQAQFLLPKDALTPVIDKIALDEIPVLQIGATSKMDEREFYQFMKDKINPRISKIAGVGQIALIGGDEREIKINLNQDKLISLGMSVTQVAALIKSSNLEIPTGKIQAQDNQMVVRLTGKFSDINQVKNLVISKRPNGGEIRVEDVAEVEDGIKEYSNINRVNGKKSIGLMVLKQYDANAVEVSKLVREELSKIEEDEKANGVIFTISQDSSDFTIDAADHVKLDLMLAICLVALVMLIFLHSIRNSLIIMIAIPTSLISTFVMMYAFGFTLNLMTLLAMSLVIGILVDDSIVVLENIYRFLEKGHDKVTSAIRGRNEIGFAALSITMVDVVVFVPLAVVTGIIGNILREFSLVMVTSTLLSLLVSFTVTPLLASRFAKVEHINKNTFFGKLSFYFEQFQDWLTLQYKGVIIWSLTHKIITIGITLILFCGSFALVGLGFIGGEFITESDRGQFAISLELESGATLEKTNQVTYEVEKIINEFPEVVNVFSNIGASSEGFLGFSSNNTAQISVALVPYTERERSTSDIQIAIKERLQSIPGLEAKVAPIGIFGGANEAPIQLLIYGNDYEKVLEYAELIKDSTKLIKGASDVKLSTNNGKPETKINIDRDKLASFGLNIAEVGQTLRIALTGDDDSKFREGETEYSMRILLDEFDRSSIDNLKRLTFINPRGEKIELQQFANLERGVGPTRLQRENRNRAVTLTSELVGRPAGDVANDMKAVMENVKPPLGVQTTWLGQEKNMVESMASMGMAMMAAILFVYLIMVALYNSYLYPFVVLFSIPVAIIGALLALALTMNTLNMFSMLGLIMLIGLVGKNAILLVDRTNQMRSEGMKTFDALVEAGQTRLRPILMTTVAMVFGMMPIALAKGAGSEWKHGLAWVLIGGLTSSMLLTLVLVPVVYLWFDNVKNFFIRAFSSKNSVEEELDPELIVE